VPPVSRCEACGCSAARRALALAETRQRAAQAEERLAELKAILEEMRTNRDAWRGAGSRGQARRAEQAAGGLPPFTRACPQLGELFTRTDQNQTRNGLLWGIPKSAVD